MRVLVTGGSGFLGSHVVERLHEQGHNVRCLVRATSNTKFLTKLGVELAMGAVDQSDTLPAAVKGVDAVIHCAGLIKARTPEEFHRVNEQGARELALAAIEHAPDLKRFVLVSTAGVMGPSKSGRPHEVEHEPNPGTHYAASKLAGERAVAGLADKLPITILRPPAIYGPRDGEILAFFQMIRRTRMAFRLGDSLASNSMVYGPDCADACIKAIDADVPSGSTFFVDDGRSYSFPEMSEAIADAYGIKLMGVPSVPEGLVRIAAKFSDAFGKVSGKAVMFNTNKLNELLMKDFLTDSEPTRKALGWKPTVHFPEGAKITADWYRENGWD